jgi:MarR family transcriptional regulator, organic hydroperoxide resistance regulator
MQNPHMELNETVDFYIKSAWHLLSRMYNQLAIENGISQAIGYVLIHIEKEGSPATKIAPMLGMEPTSLSRLLHRMEKMGLIYRKTETHDRRVVRIFLTDLGNQKRKLAKRTILEFNQKLSVMVDNKEIASLIKTLTKIKNFVQHTTESNENLKNHLENYDTKN